MLGSAVKDAVCSKTGRPCVCESGEGCSKSRVRADMDTASNEALRWARVAALRLEDAVEALDYAVAAYPRERLYPAPEWRDKARRLRRMIDELTEEASK